MLLRSAPRQLPLALLSCVPTSVSGVFALASILWSFLGVYGHVMRNSDMRVRDSIIRLHFMVRSKLNTDHS